MNDSGGSPKDQNASKFKKNKDCARGVPDENEDSIKTWTRGHVLHHAKDLNTLSSFPKTFGKG